MQRFEAEGDLIESLDLLDLVGVKKPGCLSSSRCM
jgi:hypothetical protein